MSQRTFLHISRQRGQTLTVGRQQVTPVALVVHGQAALGAHAGAGAVWVRPMAVEVREGDHTRQLPIVDVALATIFALGVLSLAIPAIGKTLGNDRR